jgi:hypothetical protein
MFITAGLACLSGGLGADDFQFQKVVLDPAIGKVCYAVAAADVDGDSKLDAVAISEREAVWYRNPDWTKQTMIRDAVPTDHVCITPADFDGDGRVDFALGAGWPRGGGQLFWLRRGDSLQAPWQVHPIGAEPSTHRMRMADVLGQGRDQLVVSPLNGSQGSGIRLLAFPIPDDPVAGPWTPVVLDASLNRAHNHWHWSATQDATPKTIVASQEGLSIVERGSSGFQLTRIAQGIAGETPEQRGCGEIKLGSLGSQKLLATIEPMHGHQVVVYVGPEIGEGMKRVVLDESFVQGHAVWCADLDGDGLDDVIAAHREPAGDVAPGIYLYHASDASGEQWNRTLLDRPMACEDIWCDDFDGDGQIDILAGGRATHDVNLYLNRSRS